MDSVSEPRSCRFALLAAFAFVAVIVIWFVLPKFFPDDHYAGANALFSGLAFAGLIIAILLQREELQLQRRELALTREEMEGQKEQLEGQKLQMEIQNFENRFFQMLATWTELKRYFEPRYEYHGKIGFEGLSGQLQSHLISRQDDPDVNDLEVIDSAMDTFYASVPETVKNYMRVLYNILKLVDKANIGFDNQKFYTNIIRAQLSQHELAVIFYNCLSRHGRKKHKPLLEKYSLLKHMSLECVDGLSATTHPNLYSPSAFK